MSLAVLIATIACEPAALLPTVAPTIEEPHEQMPASAAVRVDGVPLVASRPVVIRIEQPGFADERRIAANEQIHASFAVSSGAYRLSADQERCVLPVALAPETETDVALELRDDGTCGLVQLFLGRIGHQEVFASSSTISASSITSSSEVEAPFPSGVPEACCAVAWA